MLQICALLPLPGENGWATCEVLMIEPPSFQDAIAKSAEWIRLWDAEELSDEILADHVGKLVRFHDGARGFFVASLTSDSPLMDRLPEILIAQLRLVGESVVDLTTRNLAMSTAMFVEHRRQHNQDLLEGSQRVQRRSVELLRNLDPKLVQDRFEQMLQGLDGEGDDVKFISRWGYDNDQKEAIKETLLNVAL